MAKFRAYAKVTGTKFLGNFEAESEAEAKKLAEQSEECDISFCWSCADQCEDPEIEEVYVEIEE